MNIDDMGILEDVDFEAALKDANDKVANQEVVEDETECDGCKI
ncbi:hypothetical protein [Yersinia phage vB_YenM_P778]